MFRPFARKSTELCLVRTTVPTRAAAQAMARRLVEDRQAACVHVMEASSVYRWEGTLNEEAEFVVEARTTPAGRAEVAAAMKAGHPYAVALIESWNVQQVPGPYVQWAREQVA